MQKIGARAYGILLVAMAAVLWSTAGLFVRLLDLDVCTMLAWRSVFAALSLALVVIVKNGPDTLRGVLATAMTTRRGDPITIYDSRSADVSRLRLGPAGIGAINPK